ncbi:MAG: hypothetical protein BMS9Abin37_1650 [Acidobacteriota bacterium]|nr:MAG: hypothetical protein BMS9Abin37_1650 [Acidobacteriota bacterium]
MNEYIHILFIMATTVHLPGDLLQSVDERAHELGMSRNRYIVRALKKAVAEETTWSNEFLRMLDTAAHDKETHPEIDNMIEAISRGRTRRNAPKL